MTSVLDDEIVVLQSIYGELFEEVAAVTPSSSSCSTLLGQQQRMVQYKDTFCTVTLSIPADYPTCDEGNNVSVVILIFHDSDRCIRKNQVIRQVEEIIVANATAGKETLFDICDYLRGKSYVEEEEEEEERAVIPEKSLVTDCLEDKEEATDVETVASGKDCSESMTLPTTVFQSISAADNFAAACAAANAAAEKAATDRREANSKARENQMNYPQPGETPKAYYSRQGNFARISLFNPLHPFSL